MAVDALEIILLTTGSRDGETKLKPYTKTAKCEDAAYHPEK
jgi:hypothetical protein